MAEHLDYDYLIVGAGLFGAVCARELTDKGHRCLVIDKRHHMAGNCYTEERDGIHLHMYGPHIFHTDNESVWMYANRFCSFNTFRNHGLAKVGDKMYSLPFNMWTFHQIYGSVTPQDVQDAIAANNDGITDPSNLEEQAIMMLGRPVYEMLIKGYTEKQWRKPASELPKEIIQRLPIRMSYDSNYFNDKYQGIPIGGYTAMIKTMLDGIEVRLGVDFFQMPVVSKKVIYTGQIDKFFGYVFGQLEYKSTEFHHHVHHNENVQGAPIINYPEAHFRHTRTIEHKHFDGAKSEVSWVTTEYPRPYVAGMVDPYYPVNDAENNAKYIKYKSMADSLDHVYFGGRLAEYKYYDMDDTIASALKFTSSL